MGKIPKYVKSLENQYQRKLYIMSEEPGYVDKHIHQSFRDLTLAGSYCKLLVRNISFPSLKAPRLLREENNQPKSLHG